MLLDHACVDLPEWLDPVNFTGVIFGSARKLRQGFRCRSCISMITSAVEKHHYLGLLQALQLMLTDFFALSSQNQFERACGIISMSFVMQFTLNFISDFHSSTMCMMYYILHVCLAQFYLALVSHHRLRWPKLCLCRNNQWSFGGDEVGSWRLEVSALEKQMKGNCVIFCTYNMKSSLEEDSRGHTWLTLEWTPTLHESQSIPKESFSFGLNAWWVLCLFRLRAARLVAHARTNGRYPQHFTTRLQCNDARQAWTLVAGNTECPKVKAIFLGAPMSNQFHGDYKSHLKESIQIISHQNSQDTMNYFMSRTVTTVTWLSSS